MNKRAIFPLLVLMLIFVVPVSAYSPFSSRWLSDETCVTQDGYEFCMTVVFDLDCNGWAYKGFIPRYNYPEGGAMGIEGVFVSQGFWTIDDVFETYTWVGNFYFNLGQAPDIYEVKFPVTVVLRESDCLSDSCLHKKQYFMYTLRDDNQPSTWQPYCYIISNNGIPSVESQARICSVPSYDHVFRATNIPYGGWVSTNCNGMASYGWPDWQSSWYRPQDGK
jgi:hypothetical protein